MNTMKILIVDDSATVRHLLKATLERNLATPDLSLGLEEAQNGLEALEKLTNGKFDLIISDWEMPEMTGDALLHEIKTRPAWSDLPFIMVTQRNDRDAIITAIQAGVSDYLVKPFTSLDLITKIQKVVKKAERRKHERYEVSRSSMVLLKYHDTTIEGELLDISKGGMYGSFAIPEVQLIAKRVSLSAKLSLSNPVIITDLWGVVLRIEVQGQVSTGKCRMAFRFLELSPEKIQELAQFLEIVKTSGPGLKT